MPKPLLFTLMSLFLVLGAQSVQAQTAAEAAQVASDVLAIKAWADDRERCPQTLMPERARLSDAPANNCAPGALASCFNRCAASDAGACYWLGQQLQQARADQQATETLYQRACKLGVTSGCTNRAAGMLAVKPKDPSVRVCAVQTFSKACAADDPWACTMYAFHLSSGVGVKQDKALALKVLDKSCRKGQSDPACVQAMQLRQDLLASAREAKPAK